MSPAFSKISNVCIIGGGISGLSTASLLTDMGIDCKVFEQNNKLGGLVSCTLENGNLFHRVGGHVFNSKLLKVNDWFWAKFDRSTEFLKATRNAAIWINNSFVTYPIELSLSQLSSHTASKVIDELIKLSSKEGNSAPFVGSFQDFLLANFGSTLSNKYFIPYNKKIWNRDLDTIPIDWLEGKLPMIKPIDIIKKNIINEKDDMVHSFFYYPVKGGSQFIVDRIANGINIVHEKVFSIESRNYNFIVNNKYDFSHIVYTGDIRRLLAMLDHQFIHKYMSSDLLSSVNNLSANGTSTMLCECDANNYSWVYIPGNESKVHRIIMTGNFSKMNNNITQEGRSTCTIEYSGLLSEVDMREEAKLLPFALKPIAYNYCPSSYVVHNSDTQQILSDISSILESHRLYLCGRFAEWSYYNMDTAIAAAMETVSKIASY